MVDYKEYLKTPEWDFKRKAAYFFYGHKCAVCGSGGKLNCHHKNYSNVGKETADDLIVLCEECHARIHDKSEKILFLKYVPVYIVQKALSQCPMSVRKKFIEHLIRQMEDSGITFTPFIQDGETFIAYKGLREAYIPLLHLVKICWNTRKEG